MGVRLDEHVRTLLDALAFAWPATAFTLRLHTPKPIAPVDDDDDDDGDDDKRGGGSGGSIDPDHDDEGDADDDEDEDTLWTGPGVSDR
jgi:hypothetical protein